jgi:hypothetical protein
VKPSCVIVIPVYSQDLSKAEQAALHACIGKNQPYAICMLHKKSIDIPGLLERCGLKQVERKQIHAVAIDDHWLASVSTYNSMLLQSWLTILVRAIINE